MRRIVKIFKSSLRLRRGIALATVMFALAVVSMLLGGLFWVTTQEQRMGENGRRQRQSFGAAQVGLAEVLRSWDAKVRNNLRVYPLDSVVFPLAATPGNTGKYEATVKRMGTDVFLIEVTGTDNVSRNGPEGIGARQRVGVLFRTVPAVSMVPKGAMTTTGSIKLKDAMIIDGTDHIPTGWNDCPPLSTAIPGITSEAGAKLKYNSPAVVTGNPPVSTTLATADTAGLSATYDSLMALSTITITSPGDFTPKPSIVDGACNTSLNTNWGSPLDPTGPCGSYFPIIRVDGHLHIYSGEQGQGILLVNGDVHIKGKFTFVGIIIADGKLKMSGDASGDATVTGMVVSRKKAKYNAAAEDTVESNARINYSKCAVNFAMRTPRNVSSLRSRSWSQLF